MKNEVFAIPKEVIYYCFIPSLFIILMCLIFWLIYRKKKNTYNYVFTINYFFQFSGIILSSIMLSLLLGYSIATIYIIYTNNLLDKYYIFIIILIFLPLIPLCLLIWLIIKLYKNLKYKRELDNSIEIKNETNSL